MVDRSSSKTSKSRAPSISKEQAQSEGKKLNIRTRSGEVVDALTGNSVPARGDENLLEIENEIRRLARVHVGSAIDRLAELIKSEDPDVALHACRMILDHSLLQSEPSQHFHPDVDRVSGSGNFDRGGIGNDRLFDAKVTRRDLAVLKKLGIER
ncbi:MULTISPECIES: hypothetical protein [Acidobacteriaceae]|uniref:hypothetical protein n=1 Tax=Acidobacteriaceae TaxID=204434 RepID=UPI00131E7412|nr:MULTISPECIES: hypothetical protein [Acidobacteriaceae]MDW5266117.1 hypothetical protein [Edaphobacter sp.]